MSKFDLRDISQRLASSRDTEAVVFEFLGFLQSVRPDWRASLAFYEVSQDVLSSIYVRQSNRLVRRDSVLPVDQLPARLVRKFFHPSAFFNAPDRRSLLSQLFQSSPFYEPDPMEAAALKPISPLATWQSCVCMPLADQEDMLALLVLASEKKNAFSSKGIGEIIPLKSMAALALAQHLYRSSRTGPVPDERTAHVAAAEFQDRIRRLNVETAELAAENQEKTVRLQALAREIETLDRSSSEYRHELERVKGQLYSLEEQSAEATQHLTDTYTKLTESQFRAGELQRTVTFLREVFQVLSQEHDPDSFARTMVAWFSEHFGVERCSLMLLDESRETLRIRAQQGMDESIAASVRVRIGQGIAGWVAHNRKPLFVRVKREEQPVQHTHQDAYNSDSFIAVPLVHNNRLLGVLNLSNKRGGDAFDDLDLDRAMLAGAVVAMSLGTLEAARRVVAWK